MRTAKRSLSGSLIILLILIWLAACSGQSEQPLAGSARQNPGTPTKNSALTPVTPSPTAVDKVEETSESANPIITESPATPYPLPATAVPEVAAYPEQLSGGEIPNYGYRIINQFPHDENAYTQGLVWDNGRLLEGTGLNDYWLDRENLPDGSSLRRVVLETGEVEQIVLLPDPYFGEGITVWEDKIFQLTWQDQQGFIYDIETFEKLGEFSYPTEGWGLTFDGRQLIMSDGTNTLYFRDPQTFAEIDRVQVFDNAGPVQRLNELEFINGEVWANVWQTDRIVRINPENGQVIGWLDLAGLRPSETFENGIAVLNGIAYDAENDRLFVTGKLWPNLYEIEVVPIDQ